MMQGQVVDLNTGLALNAARFSVDLGLPMADSIMLATARVHTAVFCTQDVDFKGIENVRYIEKR